MAKLKNAILVAGATGFLGTEICKQLIAVKKGVRGLVRTTSDPAKVEALQQIGVETVTGDIKDISSLNNAFAGSDTVISTVSSTFSRSEGDAIETVDETGQLNVVEAAQNAGVKHFIFISFNAMSEDFPLQTAKRKVEKKLAESKMNYTILRPTFFMEVWLSPATGFDFPNAKATIYGEGSNKISWISLKDVAAFAVAAVENPSSVNSTIELGGPEALSPNEVVNIFEKHTGTKFTVEHVPEEALRAQKAAATDSLSASFASLMLSYAKGSAIDMKKTLQTYPVTLTSVKDYASRMMPK